MAIRKRILVPLSLVIALSIAGVGHLAAHRDAPPEVEEIAAEPNAAAGTEYYQQIDDLVQQEAWHAIVGLGEECLEEEGLTAYARAEVHSQLASSYFYLGDFASAGYHATGCVTWARVAGDPTLEVRGLTRQAGVERARAVRQLVGASFRHAIRTAEEALHNYYHYGLDDALVLAKIYYNIGAACADDPCGHFAKAVNAYNEALDLYEVLGLDNEVCRAAIRLAHCRLRMGQPKQCEMLLQEVEKRSRTERVQGHYAFVCAQLEASRDRTESAEEWAHEALILAQKLDARGDIERVESFVAQLHTPKPAALAGW